MPKPLSLDIHRRFQSLLADGVSGREAARRLMISAASASRLGRRIASGEGLAPKPSGGSKGRGKLSPYHDFLAELVEQDPDITLHELRDALEDAHGVRVHHSAVGYALARLGFTYKKSRWWRASAARPASGTGVGSGSSSACL